MTWRAFCVLIAKGVGMLIHMTRKNDKKNIAQKRVTDHILADLMVHLPINLTYHNLSHTQDVLHVCHHYIDIYNISNDEAELLCIAAVGHDYGYIYGAENHEVTSAEMTAAVMQRNGYSIDDIETVKAIIMATQIPQSPTCLLEQISSCWISHNRSNIGSNVD